MTPLSISLPTSTAKTTVPVIAEGQFVKWQFVSVKEDSNDNGKFLTFTCKLAAPTVTTEGEPLTPESPVGNMFWHKIYLYDKNTPGVIPPRAITAVSQFIDALLGTGDASNTKGKPARPEFNDETVAAMTNQFFFAKMRVRNDDVYGVRNDFGTLLNEADMPKAT